SKRQIKLIVDNQDLARLHLKERLRLLHRFAAEVHVSLRCKQNQILAAQSRSSKEPLELVLQGACIKTTAKLPKHHKADIVTVRGVFCARVTKSNNQLHGKWLLCSLAQAA